MSKPAASNVAAAADFLVSARMASRQIDALPAEHRPEDLAAGYAVQDAVVERLLNRLGGRRIGYKIACTNEKAQALLNTAGPVLGHLLSAVAHRSPAVLASADYRHRIIEPEIAFEMATDVTGAPGTITGESIAEHVGRVLPAIEVVDYRFPGMDRYTAPTLAADNALHAAWVRGEGTQEWFDIDLAAEPVTLDVNGTTQCTGSGAAVLGHPLLALAWLGAELARRGERLRAGDLVTTGVCTDIYIAAPGDRLAADFGRIGRVELDFSG